MENESVGGIVDAVDGVDANASVSSQETTPQVDPLKNLKAEMNRKLSKMEQGLSSKVDKLLQYVESSQQRSPVEETGSETADYKRYVDARFSEAQKAEVSRAQESAWQNALELFPELNQESESFDEKFYKAADKYYGSFDLSRDSEAPLKAVKLAALEMGKIEQLAKEKFLKDEARRSRIIAEGGSSPREQRKEKEPNLNTKNLARLGVDPDKLKARIKAMKDQGE